MKVLFKFTKGTVVDFTESCVGYPPGELFTPVEGRSQHRIDEQRIFFPNLHVYDTIDFR